MSSQGNFIDFGVDVFFIVHRIRSLINSFYNWQEGESSPQGKMLVMISFVFALIDKEGSYTRENGEKNDNYEEVFRWVEPSAGTQ